jgi:transcriptional regulator with XRE-family HTH domain
MRLDVETWLRLRQTAGLSQNQAAKAAGISQPALSAIEAGERRPRPSTIVKLAGAVGVKVDEIVAWDTGGTA